MKNLKVSTKLVVGFLVVVLMAVFIGGFGIYGLTSMGNAADIMYSQKALPLANLTKATEYFLRCRIQARSAILYTGNAEKLKPIESDVTDCLSQFEAEMEKYRPSIQTDKGIQLFENIMSNYATFKPAISQVLNGAKQGNSQEDLLNELGATLDSTNAISSSLSELVQARMDVMGTADEENLSLKNILLTIIIAIIVVVVGSSMILVYYISGLITKPLSILTVFMNKAARTGEIILDQREMESVEKFARIKDEIGQCIASTTSFITHIVRVGKVLESVADGDLTAELATLSDKDTMGLSLQKMVRNLSKMFAEINSSTMQVATAAKQIANGSQSLAQGSTEQASAVEQLSCSIAEIAQKTKDNATLAFSASELGNTIKSNAEKGSTQMEHMVQAVKDIGESSRSIGKIIKLIDDIAFQTNILALNAAVEAARAGQHGKGFAIVAEEVRSLASKSAEAAKNTGSLITDSIEKTELGVSIATETAGSLAEIVSGINENSRIVEEIADSSKEQTAAIDQINKGIEQVAQVVAQNSGTAEESAAASQEMSGQAAVLGELVAQFKIR